MYLFSMEAASERQARLDDIVERVLHRLGDSDQKIWTHAEIEDSINRAALEMAFQVKVIFDQTYQECLPPGFSYTARWESAYALFNYGLSSYTAAFEETYAAGFIHPEDSRWAGRTCPCEIAFLADVSASVDVRPVDDLPDDVVEVERGSYNNLTVIATSHRHAEMFDNRYQNQTGPIIAYTFEKEGFKSVRKIRVPAVLAHNLEALGSWGVVRTISEVTGATVSGSWGIPRSFPDYFPMGRTRGWGAPRRFFQDSNNFKIEYWRRPYADETGSELPVRYFLYLADYAQWKALVRNGPGQDLKLAQLYKDRWERGLARIKARGDRQNKERTRRAGGSDLSYKPQPPRPRLPWQYGQPVR